MPDAACLSWMSSWINASGSASRMAASVFALEPRRDVCNTGASALFGMRTLVCGGGRADEHCLTAGTAVVLGGTSGGGGRAASGKSLRRRDSIDSNGSTPAAGTAACCRFGMLVTGGYHLVSALVESRK